MKKAQGDDVVRNRRLANLNRRFQRSIPALEYLARAQQDSAGRCLILWLGRGWPMLTESEFTSDPARTQLGYFDSIVTLTNTLRESQSTVYSLSSPRVSPIGDSYKAFLGDVTSEYQAKAANLSLQVLAIHSGGDVLDRATLSDEIRSTMAGADSYYSVAFDAQPARTPHEHHALHLTVAGHPNAVIHTDSGYYNEP